VAENRRRRSLVFAHWRAIAVTLGVLLLANVLVHAFVIRKTVRVSGDREAILAAERERVSRIAREIRSLQDTVSKLACSRSDAAHVFDELLSSKEERLTSILRQVRRMARERRIEPSRLGLSVTEQPDTGLVEFGISFPLEGNYQTLRDFIEEVEESESFLVIEEVQITGDRASPEELRLQITLTTWFTAPDAREIRSAIADLGA